MDFKQLEAYVQVVEQSSFSKAAEAIYLSQPSVSAYINSLENELKTQLIFRSTKEVLPTKAGQLFYKYAKNILTMRDKAIYSIKNISENTEGKIEMSASSVPSQYMLPEILAFFQKEYPNIIVSVNQADSLNVIKDISSQKYEFGVAGTKTENNKCEFEYMTTDKLVIITPNTSEYKNLNNDCSIKEFLKKQKFITRQKGSGTKVYYDEFLKDLGISQESLNIAASFSNAQSIIHAVSKGMGISIVSELAAKDYINQKWILALKPDFELPNRDFYFVFKKNFMLSPISELLINFIKLYVS